MFFWDMTGAPLDPRTVLGRLWPLFRALFFFLVRGPPPWRGPAMSAAAASQLRAALSHLGAQQAHQSGDDDHVAVAAAATTTTKSHLRVLRGGGLFGFSWRVSWRSLVLVGRLGLQPSRASGQRGEILGAW